MAKKPNFLIGRAEALTHAIPAPGGGGGKAEVYSFAEAKERLTPRIASTADYFESLPDEACPDDYAVARIVLNPSYIAKSYFPSAFLREARLVAVGSRETRIKPAKWSPKVTPTECSTTELFVAGKRDAFRAMSSWGSAIKDTSREAIQFARIEDFAPLTPKERLAPHTEENGRFFELGLHLVPDESVSFIQRAFIDYAESLNFTVHQANTFQVGNLWFAPVEGDPQKLSELAKFTLVRVLRPMPSLRNIRPMQRASSVTVDFELPSEPPLSTDVRVAIIDGGLPDVHALAPWVRRYRKLDDSAEDVPDGPDHGLGVSSAFLFGPIPPKGKAERPYAAIDHFRALDQKIGGEDPLRLYRTLGLVEDVLRSRQYPFINMSFGPDLPMEDNDVHGWTSVIDSYLSGGETLMTLAVGNNGHRDSLLGLNRIQIPSDCVNALAVGATDSMRPEWQRAGYSAVGPGRSPGRVKPDLMAFGGEAPDYFHVVATGPQSALAAQMGTSFAAPFLLRTAVGIKAMLGEEMTPLVIKALLIHCADRGERDLHEVGWGKAPEDIMEIITSADGAARIIYRGSLRPGKYLRAPVPIPAGGLGGMVRMAATFCYASPVDPQDSVAYTRAGLEVTFRPDADRINEGATTARTRSFFTKAKYATEGELRSDAGKWETTLHGEESLRGTTLKKPVFDIHYNAREGGNTTTGADEIPYALVITLTAPRHTDLYNDILRNYVGVLAAIEPRVELGAPKV
jgi:hypothetical protein